MSELTPEAVRKRMLEIEARFGGDHAGLGVFAARALGVDPREQERFEEVLSAEGGRTKLLCAKWYGRRVAVLPDDMAIVVAMVQGLTLAAAVRELLQDDEEGMGTVGEWVP